jgi:hypothetical protein
MGGLELEAIMWPSACRSADRADAQIMSWGPDLLLLVGEYG